MQTAEKCLPVKQLVDAIRDQHGITVSPRFVRDMLKAGVPRFGFHARVSDVMAWWSANVDFSPRSKRRHRIAA